MNHEIKALATRRKRLQRSFLLKFVSNNGDIYRLKWADSRNELEEAFALVHNEYIRSGYIAKESKNRLYILPQHLQAETSVLIMKHGDKIVTTLSLVPDSTELGLPMDSVYREELNGLRKKGRYLLEACSLATSLGFRWNLLFANIFRQTYWHAKRSDVSDICIMVNPKHVLFYKNILLFEQFGPERHYPRLGVPAVSLKLNMDTFESRLKAIYDNFEPECNLYKFIRFEDHFAMEQEEIVAKKGPSRLSRDVINFLSGFDSRYRK